MTATTQLPSLVQSHMFNPSFEPSHSKNDKLILHDDHESEISRWLKLESDPLPHIASTTIPSSSNTNASSNLQPPVNGSSYPISSSSSAHSNGSCNPTNDPEYPPSGAQLPTMQPVFSSSYITSSLPLNPAQSQVTQLSSSQAPTYQYVQQTSFTPAHYSYSYATPQPFPFPDQSSSPRPQYAYSSAPQYAYATAAYQYPLPQQYPSASLPFPPSQYATAATQQIGTSAAYANSYATGAFVSPHYVQSSPIYTAQVIPTQALIPSSQSIQTNPNYSQQNGSNPQFQQMFNQYLFKGEENTDDKKRKQSARPFTRRVRQTRPKVVESKGAVQCKGRNRKKNIQCRNAALMEYIGPRPIYCAEHIELDPNSLYEKCKSTYQKDVGDNKGCKEVVLKEFGFCYKHFGDVMNEFLRNRNYETVRKFHHRISDLLSQLEKDAAAAKKKDGDLYQRKNKLIPKFQEMKKIAVNAFEVLESERNKDFSEGLAEGLLDGPPVLLASLDGIAVRVIEGISSEDDDFLSSPETLSEEDLEQLSN